MRFDTIHGCVLAGLLAIGGALPACDDGGVPSDTTGTPTTTTPGAGGSGAQGGNGGQGGSGGATGGGGSAPDCFTNPQTHEEIINACTDADQIDKQPVLPLLNPDGSLPALP